MPTCAGDSARRQVRIAQRHAAAAHEEHQLTLATWKLRRLTCIAAGTIGLIAGASLAVAQQAQQTPDLVTTVMAKVERPGKVFVDWSQNAFHKTTIAPYSLRARPDPTVSTPVSWEEVERCAAGETLLRFEAADVLARVADLGDLFGPVLTERQALPRRAHDN